MSCVHLVPVKDDPRTTAKKSDWDDFYILNCGGCFVGVFGCCLAPCGGCFVGVKGATQESTCWCWGLPIAFGCSKGVHQEDGTMLMSNTCGGFLGIPAFAWQKECIYRDSAAVPKAPVAQTMLA